MGTGPEECKTMKNRRIKEMNKILSTLGLAVLGVAILVGAAAAGTDDSTGVTAEVPLTYTIVAPDSMDFNVMTIGSANTVETDSGVTYADLSLTTNGVVDLQAYESGVTGSEVSDGKMHKDGSATHLTNALQVTVGSGTKTAVGASSGAAATVLSDATTNANIKITFEQTPTSADSAGDYEITVTFAAIASS